MKSSKDELTLRVLTLLKIDAKNVLDRIVDRRTDYIEVFALRRTREHFPLIFDNRYNAASLRDLTHCSIETINALDHFYLTIDQLRWYLFCTEDMPNTVEDIVLGKIGKLKKLFKTLELYINEEMGIDVPVELKKLEQENPQQSSWILESEIHQNINESSLKDGNE
jgi:hypothetical protein